MGSCTLSHIRLLSISFNSDMLKMGRSKPWPQALEKLTGSQEVDVGALTEYFQPLRDWLVKQREKIGYAAPGWDEDE